MIWGSRGLVLTRRIVAFFVGHAVPWRVSVQLDSWTLLGYTSAIQNPTGLPGLVSSSAELGPQRITLVNLPSAVRPTAQRFLVIVRDCLRICKFKQTARKWNVQYLDILLKKIYDGTWA